MKQYHEHLQLILDKGTKKAPARTGMPGSISLFGHQNRYDLSKGFPILTTKEVNFKNIVVELFWFLRGDTNIKYLVDNGCNIWNENAYNYYVKVFSGTGQHLITFEEFCRAIKRGKIEDLRDWDPIYPEYTLGDCGKQYGWLWKSIDQISDLIQGLKTNPEGRRHIITAWNPETLHDMALNACHAFVQFNCRKIEDKEESILPSEDDDVLTIGGIKNTPQYYLDCQLYQRSADMFLGVPYNISSYALLTHIIAKICNMVPGEFIHSFGDSHIYNNHMDQVKLILSRDPEKYPLPELIIKDDHFWEGVMSAWSFEDLLISHFSLENYQHFPAIKAPLSTGLK